MAVCAAGGLAKRCRGSAVWAHVAKPVLWPIGADVILSAASDYVRLRPHRYESGPAKRSSPARLPPGACVTPGLSDEQRISAATTLHDRPGGGGRRRSDGVSDLSWALALLVVR
jgi:hypothetical protein